MDTPLIHRVEGRVATLTLNLPERGNALSIPLMRSLHAALQSAQADGRVDLLVLAASGRHFCTGADLAWAQNPDLREEGEELLERLLQAVFALGKPLLARVQGTVVGAGVALLCLCDEVVAQADAGWRLPELKLGLLPWAIVPALRRVMGERAIQRVLHDAMPWDSSDAYRFGVVSHLAGSPQALNTQLQARTAAWLALPAATVAATKRWMRSLDAEDFRRSLRGGRAHAQISPTGAL